MAHMNQSRKQELAPGIKKVLEKYGMKGSLSVHGHMELVCSITSGSLNLEALQSTPGGYTMSTSINQFYIDEHRTGKAKDFFLELKEAMMKGNHDRSDVQSDYFDVGWYIDIRLGSSDYEKPYKRNVSYDRDLSSNRQ